MSDSLLLRVIPPGPMPGQLDNTWDDDQKASCNTTALKTLVLRMIRAGFSGGYQDMQTVVIDLWELGIVSFPHNK